MNERATEYNLNDEQFEQLRNLYVETVVDSMSMKDLIQYVSEDMSKFVDKLSEIEVYEEIEYTLSEEDLQEFITTIKEEYKD